MGQVLGSTMTERDYATGFAEYLRRADKRHRIGRRWLQCQIAQLKPAPLIRFLDVGAGNGVFTAEVCQMLKDTGKFDRVECTALEPNVHLIKHLGQALQPSRLPGVDCCIKPVKWETYWNEGGSAETHDLILARYVLFYIDWSTALVQMHSSLNPGGCLLVNHNTAVGFNQMIRWAKGWQPGDPYDTCLFAEAIRDGMKGKLPFRYRPLPSEIDVTDCLGAPADTGGHAFLNFIVDRVLGGADLQQAQDLLRVLSFPRGQGRLFLPHPIGTFVCRRD